MSELVKIIRYEHTAASSYLQAGGRGFPDSASSSSQTPPAAEPHAGLLPAGQPAQHGVRVHAHLRDLRAGARRGRLPLHGLRFPGDLWLLSTGRTGRTGRWGQNPPLSRQIHHCGNKPRPPLSSLLISASRCNTRSHRWGALPGSIMHRLLF